MLTAKIVEKSALRYTPAGLPALDVGLQHESDDVVQLGQSRKLSLGLKARAIGELTQPLLAAELGVDYEFEGFLGAQRNGRGVVFNIQTIESKRGNHHAPATR
ncbi:MAG: primosomal replication protein N [Pseudomonadota bacterium]|nr:primosomal replication protein N [Pseudomonadota bacterium]